VVVDPRPWLATSDRHPAASEVHCGEPSEVLEGIQIDSGTAVVSFLHEERLEDPVLRAALVGGAGYVGSMGSRRTTALKRERLLAAGLGDDVVARLHAPIGLDIGSVTPQEIAVAVLGEIVAARRGSP
jgi:xanthine dehydrogenase accessory factor